MKICLAILVITLSFGISQADSPPQTGRPNILFCLADDWGWPHAGAYGDTVVQTPTFDRLAREGVLFEHAYISSPSCTPSRNAVVTGQQFYRLGKGANLWSTLDVKEPNFMMLLRDVGYEIGHWRKVWGPGDFTVGGYEEHPCGPELTIEAFLENRDPAKPFCFWFGTSDPHRPYKKGSGKEAGCDVDAVHVPGFYPDTEEIRSDIADYYYEVRRWNYDVEKALELLEAAGELENTIVVMTGDHGMPFPRCKGNLYDWGARVPLAVRWGKRVHPGQSVSAFTSFTDFAPTFLEAAGLAVPEEMTGRSLLPILTGSMAASAEKERDFIVFGRERHVPAQEKPSIVGYPARAIRTDKWLLILNLEEQRWPAGVPENATHKIGRFADCDDGPTKFAIMNMREDPDLQKYYDYCFSIRDAVELYDCQKDPDQLVNLARNPEYATVVQGLKKRLVEYLRQTGDPRFTEQPVLFDTYSYRD